MLLNEAVNYYHELLTPEIAEEADTTLRLLLKERNLYFGERPICVILRPHFYMESDWLIIKNTLQTILSAFSRTHDICLQSKEHRAQLRMDDYEEALIPYEKSSVPPWTSSRLDTFYVAETGTLRCVEYNAETPAGIGYADTLGEVFLKLEPLKRFMQRYNVRQIPSLGRLTDALLAGYKKWGGQGKPQIAIMDWHEVPTLNEHEITRIYFEKQGLTARLVDPRITEYRDGKLWAEDFRIDMIYKRVLFSELVNRFGLDNPVLKAVRDHAVYITNSISAKMLAKKASLAFLSDERNRNLFTADQQTAIRTVIPWTRLVEERKTFYDGAEIDLIPFLAEHKDRFVLKPNDEYGGSGVMLGWECSDEVWSTALKHALETPHVAQERVVVVQRNYPMWLNGAVDISPRFVDADPYVFDGGEVYSVMTRLSPLALLNVTAGGGSVVPTMMVNEK